MASFLSLTRTASAGLLDDPFPSLKMMVLGSHPERDLSISKPATIAENSKASSAVDSRKSAGITDSYYHC